VSFGVQQQEGLPVEGAELIEAWRDTINGPGKSWVLFESGTCVILMEPQADLAAQATELLREYGPVHAGSSFGDFSTITLEDGRGWVVTCHHNDILTFVGADEAGPDTQDVVVGLLGRSKRAQDAEQLRVLHVEDKRRPDPEAAPDRRGV
jgi:hypothetical protein